MTGLLGTLYIECQHRILRGDSKRTRRTLNKRDTTVAADREAAADRNFQIMQMGYQHLLDVISNPKDPEYEEMREWVGRRFNPKKFDIPKAQKAINNYLDIDLPF